MSKTLLAAVGAAVAAALLVPTGAFAAGIPEPIHSPGAFPSGSPRPGDHTFPPGSPRPSVSPRRVESPHVLTSPRPSPSPQRLEDVKRAGDRIVAERLKLIDRLIAQVNAAKYLSDADKTALVAQLNEARDSLKALDAKLDAETSLDAARADVRQIQDFKVGGTVVIARGEVVRAADLVLAVCSSRLPQLVSKLQDAIAAAKAKGVDVSKTADPMTDLQAQVKTACGDAQAAHDEALAATTEAQLQDARAKLKAARSALEAAGKDARRVLEILKAEAGTPSPKPSSSPSPTPTPTATPV